MADDDKARGERVAANLSWRQLIELEACARCGECRGWCPVYALEAREAICARGKLDALRGLADGRAVLVPSSADLPHAYSYVPDVAPFFTGCRLSIAPLRYGAGVKGKVNLAMSYGLPVVATTPSVEGMHLRPGEDVLIQAAGSGVGDQNRPVSSSRR